MSDLKNTDLVSQESSLMLAVIMKVSTSSFIGSLDAIETHKRYQNYDQLLDNDAIQSC